MDIIQCNLLVKKKRKWKSRWVVLRRVNPASERINLYIYKNHLSAISKQKEKLFFPLREYCGIESIDKENKLPKLIISTVTQPLSLRFQSKEERDYWVDTIVTEGNFGEDVTFNCAVPSRNPLKSGEVTLHIFPDFFCLILKQNCRCLGRWKFEQLFNYGAVDGGFVFRIESEGEKTTAEPESFLLLTSLEKQINRTFDTVYKTARHVYGSVEGLQQSPKLNTSGTTRPRSMSEPSGFKRFMHRLSLRRKSRRPKNPKWKASVDTEKVEVADQQSTAAADVSENSGATQPCKEQNLSSPTTISDGEHRSSEVSSGGTSEMSPSRLNTSPCGDENNVFNDFNEVRTDVRDGTQETVACNEDADIIESHKKIDLANNDETDQREDENFAAKTNGEPSSPNYLGMSTLQPVNTDELDIWQRRSALLANDLNVDDMINQGFIKSKSRERPSSMGDPLSGVGNNNGNDVSGIQARRNTSTARGKRPMLTIAIAPSGSEPSLSRAKFGNHQPVGSNTAAAQYVNLPAAEPLKNKQIDKLKVGEWSRYDSEENVYHHLAAVVGSPGYENLPDHSENRSVTSVDSKSYENVPGMIRGGASYENVAAVGGRAAMHYVNVEGTKPQQQVNYIRVAGSGPPTPVAKNAGYSFPSRKKQDSNYTMIDIEKTQKLLEMTKQTKMPVERAKKT